MAVKLKIKKLTLLGACSVHSCTCRYVLAVEVLIIIMLVIMTQIFNNSGGIPVCAKFRTLII